MKLKNIFLCGTICVGMVAAGIGIWNKKASKNAPVTEALDYSPLHSILLIINYNHPYYQSRDFLKSIYKKAFPHIVFYGEKEHDGISCRHTHEGWFSHRVLADAIKTHPGYSGYLMVQDDCVVNYWNLLRLPQERIWINEAYKRSVHNPHEKWIWWPKDCGLPAVKKNLANMPGEYLRQLKENLGPDTVVTGAADFVYIPARFKDNFLELCALLDGTFVEIALPTIAFCLEKKQNIEFMNFLWDYKQYSHLDQNLDWIHPLKFSSEKNQNLISEYLKSMKVLP